MLSLAASRVQRQVTAYISPSFYLLTRKSSANANVPGVCRERLDYEELLTSISLNLGLSRDGLNQNSQ